MGEIQPTLGGAVPRGTGPAEASSGSAAPPAASDTRGRLPPHLCACSTLCPERSSPAHPQYLLPLYLSSEFTSGLRARPPPAPAAALYLLSLPCFFSSTPMTEHALYFAIYLICLASVSENVRDVLGLFCSPIEPGTHLAWNECLSPVLQDSPPPAPPHMVLDARLVSSCLSFPSRARPRFSRLLLSRGVMVYTLQNVELGDTWSLGDGDKRARLWGRRWGQGAAPTPSSFSPVTSPCPLWAQVTGRRFWLDLLNKMSSSEPLSWRECPCKWRQFGKNCPPTSRSLGLLLPPEAGTQGCCATHSCSI